MITPLRSLPTLVVVTKKGNGGSIPIFIIFLPLLSLSLFLFLLDNSSEFRYVETVCIYRTTFVCNK